MQARSQTKPKLIFLVTEDWYFHMHRLPQARAARDAGFEVCVATRVRAHDDRITAEGMRVIPLHWKREKLSPLSAIKDVLELKRLYRDERPDIVHQVSMKPIVLGTIAGRLLNPLPQREREGAHHVSDGKGEGVENLAPSPVQPSRGSVEHPLPLGRRFIIVNAFTGLGQLFLGHSTKVKIIRALTLPIMRIAFDSPRVFSIVENSDHRQMLIDERIVLPERSMVIRGSGVDIDHFSFLPEPARVPPVVACAARMLRSKGILVLAEAMRILATRSPIKLLLAGTIDPETPDSLTEAEMQRIAAEPNIEWLGRIDDVRELWARAHIAVLASTMGEGLPVSLLEAAACGRAIVATDVAGCREIVVPGVNGLLVPPGSPEALADALETMAHSYDLRLEYGLASRRMVESELSAVEVGKRTVQLYHDLMEAS